MGVKGPIPERTDTVVRRNKPEVPVTTIPAIGSVKVPELKLDNPHWLVTNLYESMKNSAQSRFYEESDWGVALLVLDQINKELNYGAGSIPAMKLTAFNQLLSNLLLTEGDRRRVRMEIERNPSGKPDGGEVLQASDRFKQVLGHQATKPGSPGGG